MCIKVQKPHEKQQKSTELRQKVCGEQFLNIFDACVGVFMFLEIAMCCELLQFNRLTSHATSKSDSTLRFYLILLFSNDFFSSYHALKSLYKRKKNSKSIE